MISTLQSLGLLLAVLVPGAVATLGYERHVGPIGRDGTDRIIRYVFGTALVAPFSLWLVWTVWTNVLHEFSDENQRYVNRLATNDDLSPWWLLVPLIYILVPWASGTAAGRIRNQYYRWIVDGSGTVDPSPDALNQLRKWFDRAVARQRAATPINMTGWDYLFIDGGPKLVSLRLRDGSWIAGLFGSSSFASPPAASEKEIVLEARLKVDATGDIEVDELGTPVHIGGAVRVWASDVDLIVVSSA